MATTTTQHPWSDQAGGWAGWTAHLRDRDEPRDPARAFRSRRSPLAWSLTSDEDIATLELINRLYRLGDSKRQNAALGVDGIEYRLAELETAQLTSAIAVEHLAWCWALPHLANYLPAETWQRLLNQLLRSSEEARNADPCDQPLTHQLLAGELPLSMAWQFPEIEFPVDLVAVANDAISTGMSALIDQQGLNDYRYLSLLRPLLGCWTRCRLVAAEMGTHRWSKPADNAYQTLLLQGMRLTRSDGGQTLSQGPASEWNAELFEAALRSGVTREIVAMAAECLPPVDVPAPKKLGELPSPAGGSEAGRLRILRSSWSKRSDLLTVTYAGQSLETELNIGRDRIWSGKWGFAVRSAGRVIEPEGEWEEVCWHSDDDGDYLELEIALGGGLRVQRQFMLARQDRILFLADAVLGTESQDLNYHCTLPLTPGVAFLSAEDTREGRIVARKQQTLVLPLALPEWRTDPRGGSVGLTAGRLDLRQSGTGTSLFAPLFFDLDRKRRKRLFTWRRLTVAEDRQVQPADVATGYRVQIGAEQWLIYRSLGRAAARTVLGHHLNTEFLLARFTRDGQVQPLLEVE